LETGLMGTMVQGFFEKQGYTVLIASRKPELSIDDCVSQSDVVIVSVPIDITCEGE
jgi:prephenate dehydrogenase